jgi:type VI secretion system secreted protein VgrG
VGLAQLVDIGMQQIITVGQDRTVNVGQNQSTTIGHNRTLSIGQNNQTKVGQNSTIDVVQTFSGHAQKIALSADVEIILTVGPSTITITQGGISIDSPLDKLNC